MHTGQIEQENLESRISRMGSSGKFDELPGGVSLHDCLDYPE